jgi:sulfoxide reductase heme-binding subunit YedZ
MPWYRQRMFWLKAAAQTACALPLLLLALDIAQGTLGPDPVAMITHRSGRWALRLLLACLAITPLRRLTGWNLLVRFRRLLGLWAFAYVCLHFANYLFVDLGLFWRQILADLVKRPYITIGFACWLTLIPLALTSTQGMVRRLGRRWATLHRLVYASGVLACLHFVWLVRAGKDSHRIDPWIYLGVLLLLFVVRLVFAARLRREKGHRAQGPGPSGTEAGA